MKSSATINVEASPEHQKFCYITLPASAHGKLLFLIRDNSIEGEILTFNDLVNSLIKVPREYWWSHLFICSTELLCDVIGDPLLNDKRQPLDADGNVTQDKLKIHGALCLMFCFYMRVREFDLFHDAVATSEPASQHDSDFIIKLSGDPSEINALTKADNMSEIIKRIVSIEDAGKCILTTRDGMTFNWDNLSKYMKDEYKNPDLYKPVTSRLGLLAKAVKEQETSAPSQWCKYIF